jgi:hypothetical protein
MLQRESLLREKRSFFDREQDLASPAILDKAPPTFRSVRSNQSGTSFRRYRFGMFNVFTLTSHLTAHLNAGERQENGSSDGLIGGTIPDRFRLTRSPGQHWESAESCFTIPSG